MNFSALAKLKQRVAANYENFKSEMLSCGEEEIYDNAQRIAIVKDAYEQITGDGMDYMDEGEVEFLLKFYDPLEMVADYMEQSMDGEYPVDVDEAFNEIISDNHAHEKYLTVNYAEHLMDKHGAGTPVAISLLRETIEAGEQYIRLLKLTHKTGTDGNTDSDDADSPFNIVGLDEDGFFIYEDDGEVYF